MMNNNEEQQSAAENIEMSYFDRVVFDAGGTADDVNSDISSSDDEQDGKNDVEDDSSIWTDSGAADESSDEEMEYDSDEDSIHLLIPSSEEEVNNNQTSSKSLSEESKQLLLWRLEKDVSFSDWTIEVSIANKRNRKMTYHVHKTSLGLGPKKSGYFEALLTSGQFSESSNSTSEVELPEDTAKYFDIFLDYMYTHP